MQIRENLIILDTNLTHTRRFECLGFLILLYLNKRNNCNYCDASFHEVYTNISGNMKIMNNDHHNPLKHVIFLNPRTKTMINFWNFITW
jgi:hypothetical protein